MRLRRDTWSPTTPQHCEVILCAAARYWRGFLRRVGASRELSQAQRYSSAPHRVTMCTDTSSPWTEAGWRAEETFISGERRTKRDIPQRSEQSGLIGESRWKREQTLFPTSSW